MSDAGTNFAELVERARGGDSAALALLAGQYEGRARAAAHALIGAPLRPYLDATDVVQSVHRTLIAGLRERRLDLASPDKLVALAVLVVRRKIARHWRHLQKQHRLSRCDAVDRAVGPAEPLDARSDGADDPAERVASLDAARRLLSHLSEPERRILELRMQGYSTDEIAGQLGLHPVALRVRLTRLRQRLAGRGADATDSGAGVDPG